MRLVQLFCFPFLGMWKGQTIRLSAMITISIYSLNYCSYSRSFQHLRSQILPVSCWTLTFSVGERVHLLKYKDWRSNHVSSPSWSTTIFANWKPSIFAHKFRLQADHPSSTPQRKKTSQFLIQSSAFCPVRHRSLWSSPSASAQQGTAVLDPVLHLLPIKPPQVLIQSFTLYPARWRSLRTRLKPIK